MNKKDKTAVIIATEKGNVGMVARLLDAGVDVNCVDNDGSSPLHHAMAWASYDVVNLLVFRGAKPTLLNKKHFVPGDYAFSIQVFILL